MSNAFHTRLAERSVPSAYHSPKLACPWRYGFRSLPNCCCPAHAEYLSLAPPPTAQSPAPKQKSRPGILVVVTLRPPSRRRPASYHRLLRPRGLFHSFANHPPAGPDRQPQNGPSRPLAKINPSRDLSPPVP